MKSPFRKLEEPIFSSRDLRGSSKVFETSAIRCKRSLSISPLKIVLFLFEVRFTWKVLPFHSNYNPNNEWGKMDNRFRLVFFLSSPPLMDIWFSSTSGKSRLLWFFMNIVLRGFSLGERKIFFSEKIALKLMENFVSLVLLANYLPPVVSLCTQQPSNLHVHTKYYLSCYEFKLVIKINLCPRVLG